MVFVPGFVLRSSQHCICTLVSFWSTFNFVKRQQFCSESQRFSHIPFVDRSRDPGQGPRITSVAEERANYSAIVYLYCLVSVRRGFLFLWVLRMGFVILLWHSLGLPYN